MVYYHRIQAFLGIGIGLFVFYIDFSQDWIPLLQNKVAPKPEAFLPLLVLIISVILLVSLQRTRDRQYLDFITQSPGRDLMAKAQVSTKKRKT